MLHIQPAVKLYKSRASLLPLLSLYTLPFILPTALSTWSRLSHHPGDWSVVSGEQVQGSKKDGRVGVFRINFDCYSLLPPALRRIVDINMARVRSDNLPDEVWTAEEDRVLIELKESGTTMTWEEISKHLPGKTPSACEMHWLEYLAIKSGGED